MVRIQMHRLSDALAVKVPPLVELEKNAQLLNKKFFRRIRAIHCALM